MKLDPTERDFLQRVRSGMRLSPATYDEDRARQRCRRWGLASVEMKPRRWVITQLGRDVLDRQSSPEPRS